MDSTKIVLNVNGIEVIYNHVILVLKGVSLNVPEGKIVAILGGNGAGKTTTLRAISNLLKGERGEVTKGSIELRGERPRAARRGASHGGQALLCPPDH
jgi:branched-chain amino acid transport system ATP-binding protein